MCVCSRARAHAQECIFIFDISCVLSIVRPFPFYPIHSHPFNVCFEVWAPCVHYTHITLNFVFRSSCSILSVRFGLVWLDGRLVGWLADVAFCLVCARAVSLFRISIRLIENVLLVERRTFTPNHILFCTVFDRFTHWTLYVHKLKWNCERTNEEL